jgi:uncharacterized protein YbbC (DUF1343 family)
MQFGIDVLLKDAKLRKRLIGRRLSLLANPSSVCQDLRHSMDAIAHCAELNLVSAFGPQHGMRGEKQDNMIESQDFMDPIHQIPVFSLYGEVRRPTARMMETFDVLLVDLQDLGTRIYTYLTTLLYVLEAAAQHQKSVWVLDRPNPVGRPVEGSLLKEGWESFVGAAEFPMRHGLTLGEAARWFVKNKKLNVDLEVVPMWGYDLDQSPGYGWPLGQVSWVNPSPNASSLSMARCYPGTVLFEGTHLSEGRGTTRPLEVFGAPDIDSLRVLKKMEELAPIWMQGCRLRPCYFQPTFHKYVGQICSGIQIHVDDEYYQHERFKPYRLIALFFKSVRALYPEYKIWRDFHYEYERERLAIDLINGSSLLREWVDDPNARAGDFDSLQIQDEAQWLQRRNEFLIY